MKNPVYTYNFQTSHPLNVYQLRFLNETLMNLPSQNSDLEDIPEWMTEVTLHNVEELID